MFKSFDKWFDYWENRKKHIPPTYSGDNIRILRVNEAIRRLNINLNKFNVIHVSGSSGKSSTCKIWGQLLYQHGYNVGTWTKPHLFDVCERYNINGDIPTWENIKLFFQDVEKICNEIETETNLGSIKYVEFLFLTGLLYFSQYNLDYLIIEAGIGALYDYTNVFNQYTVSIVTSIEQEHKEELGNSFENIALHKTAIANKSKYVYILESNREKRAIIRKFIKSNILKRKIYQINKDFKPIDITIKENGSYFLVKIQNKILGEIYLSAYSKLHVNTAISVIHFLSEIKHKSIKTYYNVNLPARMHFSRYKGNLLIFDVAHTPRSIKFLQKEINNIFNKPIKVFFASTGEHKGNKMQKNLNSGNVSVNTTIPNIKSMDFNYTKFSDNFLSEEQIFNIINKANNQIFLFTGSLYFVGSMIKKYVTSPFNLYGNQSVKEFLRFKLINKRALLTFEEVEQYSLSINKKIIKYIEKLKSEKILIYQPIKNEVKLDILKKYLQETKIRCFIPIYNNSSWKITEVSNMKEDNFVIGKYNISQPKEHGNIFNTLKEAKFHLNDIVLVPAIAFDIKGNRLGFGEGNYDRFMKDCTCTRLGICYKFQILNNIPTNPNDEIVNKIVHE